MQRATTAEHAYASTIAAAETACPVCGAPIQGIAASKPGEHRFVGCDHYASGRFLRQSDARTSHDGPTIELGP